MNCCGVDGCGEGWAVAQRDDGSIRFHVLPIFTDLLQLPVDIIAVDIPIGLPDSGPRLADQLAREKLGWPRRCSVFSAPIRPLLETTTWREANHLRRRIEKKGLPKQTWAILAKIREVDDALRKNPRDQCRVFEVHPELSFWQMADEQPMKHRKKDRAGRLERLRHVKSFGVIEADVFKEARENNCKPDDIVDALAALWTAERIGRKEARGFSTDERRDSAGLRMQIWA